ncbi:unnamed protein product [Lepeophtheirus salmonis]|uniref:(salmon louse) hypothetical protein n=1 Tax=Lepeophtheirus salmonis TaxID=72036 RepID=A0A7R8H0R6_LEPSM|nr:unnamed protein product [Lepeophtheirus salmonis]CAF2794676.1 unnamed protein product [Lepeophtheirus salmonis]
MLTNVFLGRFLGAFFKTSGKEKLPDYVDYVMTNIAEELAPYHEDWLYMCCGSFDKHIYIHSPIFVSTVRKIYGVAKNSGSCPSSWFHGSRTVGRDTLKTLEDKRWLCFDCPRVQVP